MSTLNTSVNIIEGAVHPEFLEEKTTLVSRNINIFNRRTSIRLEPEMWGALKDIARKEKCSIHDICGLISLRKRPKTSLTAAIRVFIMLYFKAASTEEGHALAGHGGFDKMLKRARINRDEIPQPEAFVDEVKAQTHVLHSVQ